MKLVYDQMTRELLLAFCRRPQGSLLITGPPQSGLSTCLDFIVEQIYGQTNTIDQVWRVKDHLELAQTAGTSQIDLIRQLLLSISQKRWAAQLPRLILIDDVDLIHEASQNVLLKTLEEPPPGSHFVLTTAYLDQVLSTVVSRCQQLSLRRPPQADLLALWPERPAAELQTAYLVADGWPGLLADYLNSPQAPIHTEVTWAKEFLTLDTPGRVDYILAKNSVINQPLESDQVWYERFFGRLGHKSAPDVRQLRLNLQLLLAGLVRLSRATMRTAIASDTARAHFWRRWFLQTHDLQSQLQAGLNPKTIALAVGMLK